MVRTYLAMTSTALVLVACSGNDEGTASTDRSTTSPVASSPAPHGADGPGSTGTSTTPASAQLDVPPPPSNVVRTTVHVDVDGADRTYVLSLPKAYDAARSYPLVVALHGDGGTAQGFADGSQLEQAAGKDAVIAYTDGVIDLFTPYDLNRDQKLVNAVIDDVKAKQNIDASKVWGYGHSKGAYMLEEMLCKKHNAFTAFVVEAGGAPSTRHADGSVACEPGVQAVPMLLVQGEHDQATGVKFGADYWASVAGCAAEREAIEPSYCGAYVGCDDATPIVYCEVPGGGHGLHATAGAEAWSWLTSL